MPDGMTPEERDRFHKWQNQKQVEASVLPILERRECERLGVEYQEDGGHATEVRKRRRANVELIERYLAGQERSTSTRKTVWDRAVAVLTGAALLAALDWLGRKTGFRLGGGTP